MLISAVFALERANGGIVTKLFSHPAPGLLHWCQPVAYDNLFSAAVSVTVRPSRNRQLTFLVAGLVRDWRFDLHSIVLDSACYQAVCLDMQEMNKVQFRFATPADT